MKLSRAVLTNRAVQAKLRVRMPLPPAAKEVLKLVAPRKIHKHRRDEALMQEALFQWIEVVAKRKWPQFAAELDLIYAIPNGGHRYIRVAKAMKAQGQKAGMPDIAVPIGRIINGQIRISLYIEMKTAAGRVTPKQSERMDKLTAQGNLVKVCYALEEAEDLIVWYLLQTPTVGVTL